MRHRITILVALLTVALVACGRQDTTAGMATFQVSVPAEALAATGVISPDGVPMDPTGESAVETVVVQVYRDGTLVRFAETDGGLVASADGTRDAFTLTRAANSVRVSLPLGADYVFEAEGRDGLGRALAFGATSKSVGTTASAAAEPLTLGITSLLAEATLTQRAVGSSAVVPGQVLDLLLAVSPLEGADLRAPIGDFSVTYVVENASVVAESALGVRVKAGDAAVGEELTVTATVTRAAGDAHDGSVEATFTLPFAAGAIVDLEQPSLELDEPSVGEDGSVALTGRVSDNVGIAKVQVYEGPALLASSDALELGGDVAEVVTTPADGLNVYGFAVTLTDLPTGDVTLTVVVLDTANNQRDATVSVSVVDLSRVYVAPYGDDANPGTASQPFLTIGKALATVTDGGTVYVGTGTYALSNQLSVNRPVSIVGSGEGATVIDLRAASGYGVYVEANDVHLEGFTVLGPVADQSTSYGIKVEATEDNPVLTGFSMTDVTVRGSGRSEVDLHTVDGATLTRVTALGEGTGGVGIAVSGSRNVELVDVRTAGNGWGGVALYTTDVLGINGVSDVTIDGTFDEPNPVYAQLSKMPEGGAVIEKIVLDGFGYAVLNPVCAPGYTIYQVDEDAAIAYALALNADDACADASTVQRLERDADGYVTLGDFIVGTDGTSEMSLQAAVDAAPAGATIELTEGTFKPQATTRVFEPLTITGRPGTVIQAEAPLNNVFELRAAATLEGLTFFKADKAKSDLVWIISEGVTIRDNTFHGQFADGEEEVTRAMVISGNSFDLEITGNTIYALRQPAYINGPSTGRIADNVVYGTRGWVIDGADMTFEGNRWSLEEGGASGNFGCDIAILKDTPADFYLPISALAAANGGELLNLWPVNDGCDQR